MSNARILMVHVTAADIRDGQCGECKLCPIALAIRRRTRPGVIVSVHNVDVLFLSPTSQHIERLPKNARKFVAFFDLLWAAAPIRFEICVPERFLLEMKEAQNAPTR